MPPSRDLRTSRSEKRQVCILAFTSLALLINLVAVIMGVYFIAGLKPPANSQRGDHSSKDYVGTIACITCDQGYWDPLFKTLTLKKVNDTETLCCAESTFQMSALMELILRKPEVKEDSSQRQDSLDYILDSIKAGNFSFSRASAHKRLEPLEVFDSSKDVVPIFKKDPVPLKLNNTHHEPTLEHAREVTVLQSGFQITHPGTYHVYSNVRFKPDSNRPCSYFNYSTWEHKVVRTVLGQPKGEDILKSVHTCCDTCTRDKETSFASGAFILGKGDQLGVAISGLGLISYAYQSSYFGLMMLGSSEIDGPHA